MNIPTTLDLRPVIPWTLNSGHLKTFREFRKPDSSIIFPTCADSLVLTLDSFVRGSYIVIDGITYTIKNHIGNGSYGYVASVESPGPLGTLGNTSYILKKITCKPGIKSGDGGVTIYNKKQRYLEQKQNVIIECVNQQIISLFDNNFLSTHLKSEEIDNPSTNIFKLSAKMIMNDEPNAYLFTFIMTHTQSFIYIIMLDSLDMSEKKQASYQKRE